MDLLTMDRLESIKKPADRLWRVIRTIAKYIFLISLSFILLYPIIIMLSISLRNGGEVYDPTVIWIPKTFTLKNFVVAFSKLHFEKAMLTTGKIALISTVLQLASCSLAGYTFARFKFKLKNFWFIILVLTIIVPPQVASIPTYMNFVKFDFFGIGSLIKLITGIDISISLIDSEAIFYLTAALGSGIKSGLVVFIFIQFFKGLPKELEEAAYIDGCGRMASFIRIFLPNAKTAFLTVFLFCIVWYWNDSFYGSMFFNDLQNVSRTLQNVAMNLNYGQNSENMYDIIPQTQAAALLSILPILIIYIFLQKYFTEGIETTGLVG